MLLVDAAGAVADTPITALVLKEGACVELPAMTALRQAAISARATHLVAVSSRVDAEEVAVRFGMPAEAAAALCEVATHHTAGMLMQLTAVSAPRTAAGIGSRTAGASARTSGALPVDLLGALQLSGPGATQQQLPSNCPAAAQQQPSSQAITQASDMAPGEAAVAALPCYSLHNGRGGGGGGEAADSCDTRAGTGAPQASQMDPPSEEVGGTRVAYVSARNCAGVQGSSMHFAPRTSSPAPAPSCVWPQEVRCALPIDCTIEHMMCVRGLVSCSPAHEGQGNGTRRVAAGISAAGMEPLYYSIQYALPYLTRIPWHALQTAVMWLAPGGWYQYGMYKDGAVEPAGTRMNDKSHADANFMPFVVSI